MSRKYMQSNNPSGCISQNSTRLIEEKIFEIFKDSGYEGENAPQIKNKKGKVGTLKSHYWNSWFSSHLCSWQICCSIVYGAMSFCYSLVLQ